MIEGIENLFNYAATAFNQEAISVQEKFDVVDKSIFIHNLVVVGTIALTIFGLIQASLSYFVCAGLLAVTNIHLRSTIDSNINLLKSNILGREFTGGNNTLLIFKKPLQFVN